MALTIKKVIALSEIPKDVAKGHWVQRHFFETYVEVHIDNSNDDNLTVWLRHNYPELVEEESFFIYIDY